MSAIELTIHKGKAKFSGKNKKLVEFVNRIKDQPFQEEMITAQAKQAGITDSQELNHVFFVLGIYHSAKNNLNLK